MEGGGGGEVGGEENNRNVVVVVVVWLYYSQSCVEIYVECGVVAGSMWWRVIQTKEK